MHEYHTFVDFVLNTKLMEYAVAFLFIGLFAIFYKLLQSPAQPAEAKETVVTKAFDLIKGFLVPEGLSYHPGHTWAKIAAKSWNYRCYCQWCRLARTFSRRGSNRRYGWGWNSAVYRFSYSV